jgi:DNA-directed RNA polymerase specialized sigma24 family protein
MKIPKGMTEKEVLEIINKVASRYAHKFRFGYFEADDIRQEAVIIAMEALERYEEGRPLENFLAVHVKNRLNNFKRDKYYRQSKVDSNTQEKHNNSKKFLMEPLDISNIRDEKEDNMRVEDDFVIDFEQQEVLRIIDQNLDVSLRSDYLRIKDGVYVPKPRRKQIYEEIDMILRENGYEEGQIF